ncbi:putative histone-lysine N-methyltransferase [Trypoxylus dichotomus]
MVRGRRVRNVVAYSRNDECCSPNPKRKDQRSDINKTKITRNMLDTNKSITQFFQSVGVDIKYNDEVSVDFPIKPSKLNGSNGILSKKMNHIVSKQDIICREIEEYIDLNKTPIISETRHNDNLKSPPTPHRIELRADSDTSENGLNSNGICEGHVVPPTKKMPPPKVKRRLKNDHLMTDISDNNGKTNHKLTEYFPVRRSVRKTKKTVLEEKQKFLEESLRNGKEEGLLVREFDGKGRGVIAARPFFKGDFVVEYSGELIDINEAKSREQKYAQDQNTGCYMYYFKHKNQQYCIDATAETGRLGRLVNHSRNGNLLTRTVSVDNRPRLVLIARDAIEIGEEITYDYGDRSKESLRHHPWLAF